MDVVAISNIAKTYPGQEPQRQGAWIAATGPALWLRGLARGLRLTSSTAPPVHALSDVSLTIPRGEIFGLVGRNGSGKTTLIKILAGLIRPSAGDGTVAGRPLADPQTIRARVAYVSTSGWMGLEWALTAEENVRLFAALCGMSPAMARARTVEALRDVDLWTDRHKYTAQLSNGMRQRVILARALLFHTPLILLDEPTVGLDPVVAQTILSLIRDRLRARGQTILVTDHQAAELAAVADRIGILHAGRIALLDTPAALVARLGHVTVIEIHTEQMDPPLDPPPSIVQAVETIERPGALGVRTWRIHARKGPDALPAVLDWVSQPTGRVVFLAETAPTLHDVLALPALAAGASAPETLEVTP
jgi:ABC-2 type transport system ATP-binding protein